MKQALSYAYRILVIFFGGWAAIAFVSGMFEQGHAHISGFSGTSYSPANPGLVAAAICGVIASLLVVVHATLWWRQDSKAIKYGLLPGAIFLGCLFVFGMAFR